MNDNAATIPTSKNRSAKKLPLPLGWRLVLLAVGVFIAGLSFGHFTTHEIVTLPAASDGSLHDAGIILRNNLTLLLVIGICAGFQSFARQEVSDGSKPWITWLTTAFICAFIIFNVWATGVVIGQLGFDAVIRIVPHAPLEVGSFVLGIIGFLKARENNLTASQAAVIYGIATVLMIAGSLIETYVSGGLS